MNKHIANKIEEIKKLPIEELCKKFDCNPEEICLGDYRARDTEDKTCPYKVILGFANFEDSQVTSLGKLEVVFGKKLENHYGDLTDINHNPVYLGINLKNSKIVSLDNLKKVYGSITLNENIYSLENLTFLGSNLYLNNTYVENLGELRHVHGRLNIENIKGNLKSLKNLEKVGSIYVDNTTLRDLGELYHVSDIFYGKNCSIRVVQLFKNRFDKTEEVTADN